MHETLDHTGQKTKLTKLQESYLRADLAVPSSMVYVVDLDVGRVTALLPVNVSLAVRCCIPLMCLSYL